MFSHVFNAQNKVSSIPITSVLWEYTNNGGATYTDLLSNITPVYTGTAFTIRVKSISPVGATYTQSGISSITNVNDTNAQITITGSDSYTGSFTSFSIDVMPATLSVSGFAIGSCGGYSVGRMAFNVSGLVAGQTASLTTWIGVGEPPASVAPVSTNDQFFGNAVSQITGANPISVANGTYTGFNSPLYLCTSDSPYQYWIQLTGGSNYNASNFADGGPLLQDCGS